MTSHITHCLGVILQAHPTAGIAVVGDVNSLQIPQLTRGYNLQQIVTKVTCCATNLDKTLTHMHSLYNVPKVISYMGTADHGVVICLGTRLMV